MMNSWAIVLTHYLSEEEAGLTYENENAEFEQGELQFKCKMMLHVHVCINIVHKMLSLYMHVHLIQTIPWS